MNYAEIKQNLISKGFAEESDYEELEELGYTFTAINDAISIIQSLFPQIATYEFDIDESDTGILAIDMADRKGFLRLAEDVPVLFEADGQEVFRAFTDYIVKMRRIINIKMDDYAGSFRVYYEKACTKIDADTPDNFIPELPEEVHHLIPHLAAYYLWLDDDERKAIMYKNDYEEALAIIQQRENKPRMRVNTDWGKGSRGSWYENAARNEIARGGI